jgi:hypothetical protein
MMAEGKEERKAGVGRGEERGARVGVAVRVGPGVFETGIWSFMGE